MEWFFEIHVDNYDSPVLYLFIPRMKFVSEGLKNRHGLVFSFFIHLILKYFINKNHNSILRG